MNKIMFYITILAVLAFVSSAHSEDLDIAKLFNEKNLNGTIVISSLDGSRTYIHNDERANIRFVPASTFKIPNTLIALEESAVSSEKEIIQWDGKDKGLPVWNKDQSMETAFPSSCVWFYQELAKRVGKDKYSTYLKKMMYGNEQVDPKITPFWLEGGLKISAAEQITFLKKLHSREYPFKASSYEVLRNLMVIERTPAYTIRAKTGWSQKIGWIVGYIESGEKVWFFATNMEIARLEDCHFRQEITLEALKLKGII